MTVQGTVIHEEVVEQPQSAKKGRNYRKAIKVIVATGVVAVLAGAALVATNKSENETEES